MSTESNKAVQRRLVAEFMNKGNLAVAEELIAENHVSLGGPPEREQGRKAVIAGASGLRAAFPDLEYTIEEQVAEGDTVACYITMRGTHLGTFFGIPPTGKRVLVPFMGFDYFAGGQCVKTRILIDTMSLMQQLGAVPAPGQAH